MSLAVSHSDLSLSQLFAILGFLIYLMCYEEEEGNINILLFLGAIDSVTISLNDRLATTLKRISGPGLRLIYELDKSGSWHVLRSFTFL